MNIDSIAIFQYFKTISHVTYTHSPSHPSILSHYIQDYLIPPPGTSNIFYVCISSISIRSPSPDVCIIIIYILRRCLQII